MRHKRSVAPKSDPAAQFGEKLRGLMEKNKWGEPRLAKAADIGRENMTAFLRGRRLPTDAQLARLARCLAVSPRELCPTVAATEPLLTLDFSAATYTPPMVRVKIDEDFTLEAAAGFVALVKASRQPSE